MLNNNAISKLKILFDEFSDLIENETLYLGKENTSTYAIMFFIENKGYDQTKDDAGKSFGATSPSRVISRCKLPSQSK